MKRSVLIIVLVLLVVSLHAQRNNNALGLHFGTGKSFGTQITFQKQLITNGLEFDLGWGSNDDIKYWGIMGIYQWVMPIDRGLNWFLGLGPSFGSWAERNNKVDDESGTFVAVALNGGVEYNFNEIPIQVAVDTRPEIGVINAYHRFSFSVGLAVRYRY